MRSKYTRVLVKLIFLKQHIKIIDIFFQFQTRLFLQMKSSFPAQALSKEHMLIKQQMLLVIFGRCSDETRRGT